MAVKDINYENNINLAGNQIKDVVVEVFTNDPTTVNADKQGRIVSYQGNLFIGKTLNAPYVKLGDSGDITALEARVDTAESDIDALEGRMGSAESSIPTNATNIGTLQTTVGDSSSGLVKDVADLKSGKVDKVEGKGLSEEDFTSAEKTKLAGIEAGAEVNVIEEISIDGTAQSVANKVATLDLSAYAKKTDIASAYIFKGSVANEGALPTTGQTVGDVYNIEASSTYGPAGTNVAWNGTTWDALGGITDLSEYYTKSQADSKFVDAITSASGNKAVISTSDGEIAESAVTATELGYVAGVTSAIQTQIDGKVAKNADITGATKCKITYDAKGLVTSGADLAESDIPALSISKTTGLQTALDNKLDDSQLVTSFGATPSDDKIASEKLTKDSLDGKVDKVANHSLVADTEIAKLATVDEGAQANVIEIVKVNGTALTPDASKAVNITTPVLKTATVTTTAGTDTTVTGVGANKTPRCVQVYEGANVVICAITVGEGSLTINTSSPKTLTVAWME